MQEDTNTRKKIYKIIVTMINNGNSKEEILIKLLNDFNNFDRKEKFGNWIDDQLKKSDGMVLGNNDKESERYE